jgi:hypothetical protein
MFENINNKYDQFLLTCNSDNEALHTVIQFSNVKENQKIRILKNDVKYSSAVYNWREVIVLRSYFQMSNYEILFSIPDELQTGWWAFDIQFIDSIHFEFEFEFEVGVVFSDDLSYCCEPRTLNTKDQNIKTLYYKSIYSFGMGIVIKSDHSLAGLDRIKLTLYQVADLETNL